MCLLSCITLEVEWIPRSANDRADFLSRIVDYDDWRVKRDYFLLAKKKWGPHSVDRFANHENTQFPCLIAGFGALAQRRWMPFLFLPPHFGLSFLPRVCLPFSSWVLMFSFWMT